MIAWDPSKHRRDWHGRFGSTLAGMKAGETAKLPDGTRVSKERVAQGERYRVHSATGPARAKFHPTPAAAATAALDRSAASTHPRSVGGARSFPSARDAAAATPGAGELPGVHRASPAEFHAAFQVALAGPRGKYLTPYSTAELSKMETYLAADGKVGGAVKTVDGVREAVSIFNAGGPPGAGTSMVAHLVDEHGATRLDCLGQGLADIYATIGFKVTETMKWSDEYAPANWDYAKDGRPDVFTMEVAR